MKSLQEFYNDKETMGNLKNWLHKVAKDEAVKRVLNRESVSGIADACDIIDLAFEKMDELFAPKPKRTKGNEAR